MNIVYIIVKSYCYYNETTENQHSPQYHMHKGYGIYTLSGSNALLKLLQSYRFSWHSLADLHGVRR